MEKVNLTENESEILSVRKTGFSIFKSNNLNEYITYVIL